MISSVRTPVLYLDTSVLGGYFDEEWKVATQELWRQMELGLWQFVSSEVIVKEIQGAPEQVRQLFVKAFPSETLMDVTDEMEDLAAAYVKHGVVPPKYQDDALHVAACTIARIDHLVSWNFRHLVNVQRETGFNAVNLLQGYKTIRIVNPLELIYGPKNEDV